MRATSLQLKQTISFLESAENTIYRATIKALLALRLKYLNLPGVARYKALGSLRLCREVCAVLEQLDMQAFIVGGFAHDLKTGRITRYHNDIDLSLLDRGVRRELAALFRNVGFEVVEHGATTRLTKRGRSLDLFFWQKCGDGSCQTCQEEIMVRMPLACFGSENLSFWGEDYPVASDECLVFTDHYVYKPASKAFVARLKQGL
ncbi:MAG: hypothetical protein K9L20_12290, partial [Desulfarculaceae bacterium]|nr:hypothetical protein [Desulfarculaceae bacterium]